jgi:penicillin-binding protein activator
MLRVLCCLFVLSSVAIVATGCGRKVEVVDSNTSINLSGRWNDADSKNVSEEMTQQCLSAGWFTEFRDSSGRKPVMRVSLVENKSNEDIATQIFTNDLERALINSSKVRVVASRAEAQTQREERADVQGNAAAGTAPASGQEQAPDFALQGSIRIQHDAGGKDQVKFYQVDLKLVNLVTNETVWIGSAERKKVVTN